MNPSRSLRRKAGFVGSDPPLLSPGTRSVLELVRSLWLEGLSLKGIRERLDDLERAVFDAWLEDQDQGIRWWKGLP